jgi:hypothetical protein
MKFSLKLKELNKAEKNLQKELVKIANQLIRRSVSDLHIQVKALTRRLMKSSRFFTELLKGNLPGHFSIAPDDVDDTVDAIIDEIVNSIDVKYTRLTVSGGTIKGGLEVGIGRDGFASVLNLPEAATISDKGVAIEWLEWVLTKGDQIIVSQHEIVFTPGEGISEMAIMVPNNAASWRVPPEFSGTAQDNVITREIIKNVDAYSRLISRLVKKKMGIK